MCMDPSCLSNLFEKASHTVPNPRIRGDVLLGPFHFMRHSFNLTPHFIFHLKKIYYAQAMIQTQAAGVWAECLFCMLLWDKRGVKALWRDTEVELLLLAGCSFTNSCCYQDVHWQTPVSIMWSRTECTVSWLQLLYLRFLARYICLQQVSAVIRIVLDD